MGFFLNYDWSGRVNELHCKLYLNILQELSTSIRPLRDVSHYYFDGQGKYIRPMIVLLAAGACNNHTSNTRFVQFCVVYQQ